jgi:hypothetical protein
MVSDEKACDDRQQCCKEDREKTMRTVVHSWGGRTKTVGAGSQPRMALCFAALILFLRRLDLGAEQFDPFLTGVQDGLHV